MTFPAGHQPAFTTKERGKTTDAKQATRMAEVTIPQGTIWDEGLELLREDFRALTERISGVERKRKAELAARFIEATGITMDQVELSKGDSKPWFFTAIKFGEWIRAQPTRKRFYEWNGQVYFTEDLLNNAMYETGVTIEDVRRHGRT